MPLDVKLKDKITEIIGLSLYENETNGFKDVPSAQEIDGLKKRAFDKYRGVPAGKPLPDVSCNMFYARVKRTAAMIFAAIADVDAGDDDGFYLCISQGGMSGWGLERFDSKKRAFDVMSYLKADSEKNGLLAPNMKILKEVSNDAT